MTAIAAYEKRHREELSGTDQWFRSDYIGVRMLKNGCRLTCGYLIGFAFYIVLHFEEMLDRLNSMNVLDLAENALIFYGISLGVYLILTYVVWSIRYYQAEKRRRTYGRLIDRLEAEYQREENDNNKDSIGNRCSVGKIIIFESHIVKVQNHRHQGLGRLSGTFGQSHRNIKNLHSSDQ